MSLLLLPASGVTLLVQMVEARDLRSVEVETPVLAKLVGLDKFQIQLPKCYASNELAPAS